MNSDLELALRLADLADEISMGWFTGSALHHDTKSDGTPVTQADVAVERAVQDAISRDRPDDVVLGEEIGGWRAAARRWIVDGIDGTASFAAGHTTWGTLIALEDTGTVTVGVATSPSVGGRWWAARDAGAWKCQNGGAHRALHVSRCDTLADARVIVHPAPKGTWATALADVLSGLCHIVPISNHPALMVAEGEADAAVLVGGAPWDHAAAVVIVEEAGGTFTDHLGGRRIDVGGAVFSTPALHDQLLQRCRDALGNGAGGRPFLSGTF